MYEIRLSKQAQRFYEKADKLLVRKLNRCFNQLAQNPHEHPNIKRLRGELLGYFRYRLGDWRVVYEVEESQVIVIVTMIAHRRHVYR
ncbi:type II toxin-antitoxin system RelE family toxin [Candidatus Leptofilum sp.]|uniref:type II toxin-antitoxin system RelE family toxin n=1 Tax=Candidatus Leptofilum sp. TaxID=3241576 RepID=UPI003B599E1D